jgi:hypothetical protein
MRSGFARIDEDIRGLRGEIGALRVEVREESAALRAEMNAGFAAVNSKVDRFGGGLLIALVGVIVAILARGA